MHPKPRRATACTIDLDVSSVIWRCLHNVLCGADWALPVDEWMLVVAVVQEKVYSYIFTCRADAPSSLATGVLCVAR